MFFLRSVYSLSDNGSDFDQVDSVPSPTLQSDRSPSQTTLNDGSRFRTSSNAILQDPASRDDFPAIPFVSFEDEDNSNGQLQRRNLFHSLQHNPSHVTPNASSLSIETGTSSRAQSDFSRLNTKKKKPRSSISSNNSSVLSTYSNHSEASQQSPSMDITFPPNTKISTPLRRKNAVKPKCTHYDTPNDFGQPVTRPNLKLSIDFPSITFPSTTTNENDVSGTSQLKEVVVYPMEPFSSTSVSHHGYDVPMIPPYVPLIHNNDNNQQYASETNKRSDSIPITQSPSLTSKSLGRNINDAEISDPRNIASDKPSTSPNVQSPPLNTDSRSNLINLVTPQVVSTGVPEKPSKTQRWSSPLRFLQRIGVSGDSLSSDDLTPSPDDIFARKMEELILESRDQVDQPRASPETLSSRTTTTPIAELRPQLQTLLDDNSSEVATLLGEAYVERQQALQTQLDKALAELRDVRAENKRLTGENQSQQRSISHLKIALDEAKHQQAKWLIKINIQLHAATSLVTFLKKGWQDTLDSMRHKLNAAERQVRCLDLLTRHKLESRQETGYGQTQQSGPFVSILASADVIGAMRALNEEIYQTCMQFVESLERTVVFSTIQKPQVQKVLGDHLTAMIGDQAKKTTSGYNMLLMQTVLEVFMTHWCSLIIEAFYPQQESFADLMVQLSAQTTTTSGSTAICGKQIKIIQSSTHNDSLKFNEWVKDILNELGLFLAMAGLRMKSQCATLFPTKTMSLIKSAYDLRTAMAEKDICGGLEVVIVSPNTPFQERWMMDAHADLTKIDTDRPRIDFVAGTTGIGLQRRVSERVGGQFQSRVELELKPKVTLARALKK